MTFTQGAREVGRNKTYPLVAPMTPSQPQSMEYLTEGSKLSWLRMSSSNFTPSRRESARHTCSPHNKQTVRVREMDFDL